MLVATVIFLSLVASITGQGWWPKVSAASEAQIRFAIENNYDSTGPGAKTPEYAYKTYQTLDEALVAYVNDPDTQLPEFEKNKAIHKLSRQSYNNNPHVVSFPRYQPKTVDEYTGYKPPPTKNNPIQEYAPYKAQNIIQSNNILSDYAGWKSVGKPRITINDNSLYKPRTVIAETNYPKQHSSYGFGTLSDRFAENSASEGPYVPSEFDPDPQYSFSYGVHDKGTGDSKSAHETRDGDTVRGYYTFMDADGKQRTVHYTADDKLGFRASVQRTHTNTQ